MARASTVSLPELAGLMGASESILRNLYDSCRVVRALGAMPEEPRRRIAIEFERARAREYGDRYRRLVGRVIEAMTEGVA